MIDRENTATFTGLALTGAFIVVVIDPLVQIDLQLLDVLVDLLAKNDLIELLQDGLVESLVDAIGLA
jgi:hypothetical protein